ncbi:mucosal pentraxin-like isoform X1 [Pristis pectinata]|uniref:mucosal pentraxin-like isoform X1 n=1 Tax=Pristis pectinata TaxID=685728 RepID=UPI00223CBC50|nr:mucosal pentraxin-like isoform X1 [Pristis pectinata]XP_051892475.1 mucosal pentraxin-like isoform X1 [Pristis pectinata]XP_051892476.1 mucosal pentraxin-like isoform X1 [Pristis pectinata]
MNPFIPIVLVICIYLSGSDSAGLEGKSLIFPEQTANSYVRVFPSSFSSLTAFTVCLRAASEASRDYSLFSYATSRHDNELLIWQTADGHISLYLGGIVAKFSLPKMDALLRHICIAWESKEGSVTVWVNGQRSLQKVGGKGQFVEGSGQFILGQEQDSVGGGFDKGQSFVGEITDVHMWDHVLETSETELISEGCFGTGGNIINWGTTYYRSAGNVRIEDNNDCKV